MNIFIEQSEEEFKKAIAFLQTEFKSLRTGRASAGLVENISVEAYGSRSPLSQLANVSVPDAKTITIKPWDKTVLKSIEKAITQNLTNLTPVAEGDFIRISMPDLTEDNRKGLVKVLHKKEEETRIKIRNVRDKIKESIIKADDNKEISEDDRFRFLKELDEITHDYNDKIKEMTDEKEKKIMTI